MSLADPGRSGVHLALVALDVLGGAGGGNGGAFTVGRAPVDAGRRATANDLAIDPAGVAGAAGAAGVAGVALVQPKVQLLLQQSPWTPSLQSPVHQTHPSGPQCVASPSSLQRTTV